MLINYNFFEKKIGLMLTFFLLIVKLTFSNFVLFQSNTLNTILYEPGPEGPPTAVSFRCGTGIWASYAAAVVKFKDYFQIKCLTKQLIIDFKVDDLLYVMFEGDTEWTFLSDITCGGSTTITRDFICSKYDGYLDKTLTFYAMAINSDGFSPGNYGLIYTVSSPDCPNCSLIEFFKTDECKCVACTYFGKSCQTCNEENKCISCVNNTYTVFEGACPTCLSLMAGCLTC
jgi:hypothetical protein